jgi:hypothetical protein
MNLQFQFVIMNKGTESRRVKVQLESPSPILILRRTLPKRMSKTRLYAKITKLSHVIEHNIPSGKQATYDFPAHYSPHLTPRLPRKLTLYFGIFVYGKTNEVLVRFGPRKIALPVTDRAPLVTPGDDFII